MPDQKLTGQNYTPLDLVAKVTGRARYAEDFRADGMLFTKLLLSPMPHARVRRIDAHAALAMPGIKAILTADDLPDLRGAERALTNEPLYHGEPILAVAAVDHPDPRPSLGLPAVVLDERPVRERELERVDDQRADHEDDVALRRATALASPETDPFIPCHAP